MTPWDWAVLAAYFAGLLTLSAVLARGQRGGRDYFLAGEKMRPLPVALSTMATQCSTNSLLGAPAVVAFAAGGGLIWLQYEIALPLAMIVLMAVFFPVFRALRVVSIYEYLEHRFGRKTRLTVSAVFQILRAFSSGVTLYGVGQVVVLCLGVPFWAAVLLLGAVTIIYDILGGMKAVIWSDVIQLVLIFSAVLTALFIAVSLAGGPAMVWELVESARWKAVDFGGTGLGDDRPYALLPVLVGGFFLYVAYYGCDQTQAQRELSTPDLETTRMALLLDGLLRFPLVLSYCLLGIALAAFAAAHPGFLQSEMMMENGTPNYNRAVPAFVLQYFPVGLVGLVMAGLFAAAMSSLDSTLNSLSALTMEDLIKSTKKTPLTPEAEIALSRWLTFGWGSLCVAFSFFVGEIAETIIEAINMIGSLLNGPILGVFLCGLLLPSVRQTGVLIGFTMGLLCNLSLALFVPGISWLWWNVTGLVVATGFALLASFRKESNTTAPMAETLWRSDWLASAQLRVYARSLTVYAGFLLALMALWTWWVGGR